MKLTDLFTDYIGLLREAATTAGQRGQDVPLPAVSGRSVTTAGSLHLYDFELQTGTGRMEDVPVTVLFEDGADPTEGLVLGNNGNRLLVQTFDAAGQTVHGATIVPDRSGFFETASRRLGEMVAKPDAYTLGPAERLLPWLAPDRPKGERPPLASQGVLTSLLDEPAEQQRTRLATMLVELVRNNKRILVVSPSHRRSDTLLAGFARTLRAGGLQYRSLLSRYEMSLQREMDGVAIHELGFEAQVYQFYARSSADKASLRRKYDRFRELTPLLAHKAEKQRDLDEVRLLEWRLLTQMSEIQAKIKEIDQTREQYETLPIWKRLAMQSVGKNLETLKDYRAIYEGSVQELLAQLDVAQQRIEQLKPEAAIPKDLRPEYQELKEDVLRLGGVKKIREMLMAEEGTNRQAFMQNRRVVVATAARVLTDPLFAKVRFDVLIADQAPLIPAPYLLASAGLVRERIILTGDPRDLPTDQPWRLVDQMAEPSDPALAEDTRPPT
jgi:hypothetical protein